jgi:hypothetical protein
MANHHGDFIWYELLTSDADAAGDFYGKVVGWTSERSDQPGMDYRMLAMEREEPIAGLMAITPEMASGGAQPCWLGYVGVDDVDAMAASIREGGGAIHMEPQDIPDVGRFAFVADPQGVPFYVMRGFSDEERLSFSYDKPRIGHCAWNELSTTDVEAAKHFYGQRFGWVKDGEMDMGPLGKYEFLRHTGRAPEGSPMGAGMIGAVMPRMPQMPVSAWTYYFRVPDIDAAAAQITANGGTITQEPVEIPGGDFSMNAIDPQGAHFALVGARTGA